MFVISSRVVAAIGLFGGGEAAIKKPGSVCLDECADALGFDDVDAMSEYGHSWFRCGRGWWLSCHGLSGRGSGLGRGEIHHQLYIGEGFADDFAVDACGGFESEHFASCGEGVVGFDIQIAKACEILIGLDARPDDDPGDVPAAGVVGVISEARKLQVSSRLPTLVQGERVMTL